MAALKGTKISDVRFINAGFKPEAKCLGILDENDNVIEECTWGLRPMIWTQPKDIKKAARDHAYFNPDHIVHVDQINRTEYVLRSKDFQDG